MNPPPLPDPAPPPPEKPFAQQAALCSLIAPLLMILVAAAAHGATSAGAPVPCMVPIIIGFVALLLNVSGLVLGIVALCGIPRHGVRGILGRGIAGVVLNGILLLVFTFGFVLGFSKSLKSRQFTQELKTTEQRMEADQQKSFNPKTGITNINIEGIERMRSQLDRGAQTLSGDDALIAQAMSRYAARMEDAAKKYQSAFGELQAAHVLSAENLTNQQQIAARREAVQRFIAVNVEFTGIISNSADSVGADLASLQVPPDKADKVLAGFESKWTIRAPLLLKIRDCNNRLGQGMLGILDVLDRNWGKWTYNADTKLVKFDNADARSAYKQFFTQIRSASQEQIQAQGELVALPQ